MLDVVVGSKGSCFLIYFVQSLQKLTRWASQVAPLALCKRIPHAHALLSLGSLYIIFQALALLFLFLVSLLGTLGVRTVTALIGDEADSGGAVLLLEEPVKAIVLCYVYYCLLRITALFGRSMWIVAWECYHDFPTMRLMLVGRRTTARSADSPTITSRGDSSPVVVGFDNPETLDSQSHKPQDLQRRSRTKSDFESAAEVRAITRRRAALVTPLIVLVSLNIILLLGQSLCKNGLGTSCIDTYMFDPTTRMNRNMRFVLFVALCQWTQVFTSIFPSWNKALVEAISHRAGRIIAVALLILLTPVSIIWTTTRLLRPAGVDNVQYVGGIRSFLIDSMLVTGWSIWLLTTSFTILPLPKVSGFSIRSVTEESTWKQLCTLFKFTLFFWHLVHFIRGCILLGLDHAQNDLIFISGLYPILLCFAWTVTYAVVAVSRIGLGLKRSLIGCSCCLLVLLVLAGVLCSWVGRGGTHLLILFVWLHLCRQALRVGRAWARNSETPKIEMSEFGGAHPGGKPDRRRSKTIQFAVDPACEPGGEMRKTYLAERRIARVVVRVLLLICFSYALFLVVFVFMAGVQKRRGLFVKDVIWWEPLADGGVKINFVNASYITLRPSSATGQCQDSTAAVLSPSEEPHYAICGHTWHGLQLVDYVLFSIVSYFDPREQNNLNELLQHLMPHMQVQIRNQSSGAKRWLEFEVRDCGDKATYDDKLQDPCRTVTVVGVAGTDVSKILDYAEDVRMWTEPVALKILGIVFPTVRIWPRSTTAMVIQSIHGLLKDLEVQYDQWQYKEVLSHVRQMPKEREVVITGHSLGGGIALVVGALTNRLAVAIAPPGVYHSLAKHQMQQQSSFEGAHALHKRSVSLIVEGDWIQNFDEHGGLVQTISCDQPDKSIAVGCHLQEGAACHLLRHCGDKAQRFETCNHEYLPTSMILAYINSILQFVRESWGFPRIQWQPFIVAGTTMSLILVARYIL